jgi:FemAB-related protein (PEP-CTERM system-associated)
MEIRTLSHEEYKQWDDYVLATHQGSLFHMIAWKKVLEKTFAYRSVFLAAYDAGEICGILPLFVIPKPLKGHVMVSVPFGVYGGVASESPEVTKKLLNVAKELAVEKKVDSLEFRQMEKLDEALPTKDLYFTFIREIFDGEEKNMSAIPRKQRRMIRQGISHGLQSKVGGAELLKDFYFVYSSSLRNLGTPAFPFVYFKHLFQELGEQCKILTVSYEDKIVAAVMTFFYQDRVMPYYGGGLSEYQRYAIYDFMYWELMRFGWEHGYKVFDFGRSKQETGPFHFKRHWGFEPQALPYQYFLPKGGAIPNVNPSNPKLQPFIALWKRLPLPIANRLGPFLIKYLP